MAKQESLYTVMDHMALRAPLLPVERYLEVFGDDSLAGMRRQLEDPRVRSAVMLGSPSLAEALGREASSPRKAAQVARGLLRYLIRMSTRPTPYGLFAGISMASWGEHTDLSLSDAEPSTRARLDMQWLLGLLGRLDARPEVRQALRWWTHPAAVVRAGRVVLAAPPPNSKGWDAQWVSIRALGVVQHILAVARHPLPYAELMGQLLRSIPGATPQKLESILTQLWSMGFLITDLYPPLLLHDPGRYVVERLTGVPAAEHERRELEALCEELTAWERLPFSARPEGFGRIVQRALALQPHAEGAPVQVDMSLPLAGGVLSRRVGEEVARASELLLRVSSTQGRPSLDAYRERFLARYGAWTEVPLLELLDPTMGLGPLDGKLDSTAVSGQGNLPRARLLLYLATRAQRERQRVIEVDDASLEVLAGAPPRPAELPHSLELFVSVAAASARALDEGDFQVVVHGLTSVHTAGRSLGRFAHLLGEKAQDTLRQAARREAALSPGCLFAELTYVPRSGRGANVTLRPRVREHEIALSTRSLDEEHVLALDSLVVGVREGRFYLRSPQHGADVIVTSGHMLSPVDAPAVVVLLSLLSQDGLRQPTSFYWGPAQGMPMLPRLQRGRVVISLARWRITPSMKDSELPTREPAAFALALRAWRERWNVPRHVSLSEGWVDTSLLLDLDSPAHVEELRLELEARCEEEGVLLYESLPDVTQTWLEGPGGHFLSELVVPLMLRAPPEASRAGPGGPARAESQHRTRPVRPSPPGSGCCFARLSCASHQLEELLAGPLRTFAQQSLQEGKAEAWSFLRSGDESTSQVRLLLRGQPETLLERLMPALCRWGAGLMEQGLVRHFSIDTYEPEPGRFGGEAGLAVMEESSSVDSRAVAELLALLQGRKVAVERMPLAVLTADELLAGLGLSEAARGAWCESFLRVQPGSSALYRQHTAQLRALLGGSERWAGAPGGAELERILAERRAALAPLGARLQALAERGELLHRPEELYAHYLHLHFQRLLGTDGAQVLELLARTRRGLARSSSRVK